MENSTIGELRKNCAKIIKLLRKERPESILSCKNWTNNVPGCRAVNINNEIDGLQKITSMFETALKEYGEKIKKESVRQGLLQGKKEVALKMLSLKYPVADICAVTGLDGQEGGAAQKERLICLNRLFPHTSSRWSTLFPLPTRAL